MQSWHLHLHNMHDIMQLMQRYFACLPHLGSQDDSSLTKVTGKANCIFAALDIAFGVICLLSCLEVTPDRLAFIFGMLSGHGTILLSGVACTEIIST